MRSKEDAIQHGVKYTVTQEASGAAVGDTVMLETDDGSDTKYYVNLTRAGLDSLACISDHKLVAKETDTPFPNTTEVTKVEFGVVYRVLKDGMYSEYHSEGDLLVLQEDDGSWCPWFFI